MGIFTGDHKAAPRRGKVTRAAFTTLFAGLLLPQTLSAAGDLSDAELLAEITSLEAELQEVSTQNAAQGEGRRGSFGGWLGYSDDEGALAGVYLALSPFLSEGQSLRFSAEKSENRDHLGALWQRSLQGAGDPELSVNLRYARRSQSDLLDVAARSRSLDLGLKWALSAGETFGLYALYSKDALSAPGPGLSSYVQADMGTRHRRALGAKYSYQWADAAEKLHFDLSLRQEAGRTSRNKSYYRAELAADLRGPAFAAAEWKIGLRAGLLNGAEGQTYVGDRFFTDASVLRGFEPGGYGPRDLGAAGQTALGGERYAALRLDLEQPGPAGLPPELVLGGFLDAGSLWSRQDRTGVDPGRKLRASIGLTFGWQLDFGRIGVELAHPIEARDWDRTRSLAVGLQTRF